MGMKAISGDIVEASASAILFAIGGDPDDTIWIPKSVVLEGETEPEDEVDLLIESWWYNQHEERFG